MGFPTEQGCGNYYTNKVGEFIAHSILFGLDGQKMKGKCWFY